MTLIKAQRHIDDIRQLGVAFDRLAVSFRKYIDTQIYSFQKYSCDDWRRAVYGDALIRLRQLAENNFNFIETLGLLAVTRYVFELSIWLKLFEKDARYCLVYYKELMKTQRRLYDDSLSHLGREIALLKELEVEEKHLNIELMSSLVEGRIQASEVRGLTREAMDRVDARASKLFALYLDDAKTNGYGFQAYLVEKKAVPLIEKAIAEIDSELKEFEKQVPKDIRELSNRKWEWRKMANEAGILHEYDYIYSFASKLLHAIPASITTDNKNLEVEEIGVFLRYIYVKMLDIIELANAQPECTLRDEP